MNVHPLRTSLVPITGNQFLCMMSTTAANITLVTVSHSVVKRMYDIFIDSHVSLQGSIFNFSLGPFQVYVKAGEILIMSHLMDSTTVIKETVHMS